MRAALLKQAELDEAGYDRNRREGKTTNVPYLAFSVAIQHALLRDADTALAWLERPTGYDVENLMTAPELDFLRPDPRFQRLLRRYLQSGGTPPVPGPKP